MKINEREIVAILDRELRASSGYIGGEIVSRRKRSLEYYLGKPFGNEQEGRSQVVSTDVSDTVESLMPLEIEYLNVIQLDLKMKK
jgi:hypothetical protein